MMEGSPEEPAKPRRKLRVLLVLLVAAIVVIASFVLWWSTIRPRTIAEVFALDPFQPGTSVQVQGTITGVYRENTSAGPRVALQLDHNTECLTPGQGFWANPNATYQVWGDPNATYSAGQTFQTTLHFQTYTINGDPAVSAPELACPFPLSFAQIGTFQDTVSRVTGISLAYNSTEPGGWRDYRIFTQNGVPLNPSVLPVALRKSTRIQGDYPKLPAGSTVDSIGRWTALTSRQILSAVNFPIVDEMRSLLNGTSANGSLRFVDTNGNHMLDDGDRLEVRLPPTSSPTAWDTYIVQIGVTLSANSTYVSGAHLILNGPDGPLEPSFSSQPAMADLAWAGDQPGPPIRSAIRVGSFRFGTPPSSASARYVLSNANGTALLSGSVANLPATTLAGLTFSYTDGSSDGLVDMGDLFTLSGVTNRSEFTLILQSESSGFGLITWVVGYGPTAGLGLAPDVQFSVQGTITGGPWELTVSAAEWSPELALNRTPRVSLLENDHVVIASTSLVNGTVGTYANGSLNFTDADGDGYLSVGDFFTLTGRPYTRYEIDLTVLFNHSLSTLFV